jgi:hypothetical protein
MFTSSTRSLARWVLLLPVVMVGSLLYWSLAIGLGARSLMMASVLSYVPQTSEAGGIGGTEAPAPMSVTADIVDGMGGPIMIHLEESTEPEDVNDNLGAGDPAPAEDGPATTVTVSY